MRDRWDEVAGRLVMAPPRGPQLSDHETKLLALGRVGHVIFFARNLRNRSQSAGLATACRRAMPTRGFLSVDQEGGIVSFARAILGPVPSPMALGAAGNASAVKRWCRWQASRLRPVGIDMIHAPVLDVHSPGGSAVIGTRSFGGNPVEISRLGAAAVAGYLQGGACPVIKHFPGHGGVRGDSHNMRPTDRRSAKDWAATDCPPFREAISAGAPAAMVAHISFPALGTGSLPASASPSIVRLLRDRLGFRGIIVSDAIDMTSHGGGDAMILESLSAGIDLFCLGSNMSAGAALARKIAIALRREDVSREAALASVNRIDRAIRRAKEAVTAPPTRPDWPGGKAIAHEGSNRFDPPGRGRCLLLVPRHLRGRISLPIDTTGVGSILGEPTRGEPLLVRYPFDPSPESVERIASTIPSARTVAIAVAGRGTLPDGQTKLVRRIGRRRGRTIAVSLLDPELLAGVGGVERLFTFDMEVESLQTLAGVLIGEIEPKGNLPVRIR